VRISFADDDLRRICEQRSTATRKLGALSAKKLASRLADTMTDTARPADDAFSPDWASPPGDTILDLLEEKGWTQGELATRLGYSTKHVSLLVNGKVPLTEDAAVRLQSVLGAPIGFWLAREANYRERIAAREAEQRNAGMTAWLDRLPVKDLMDAGVIPRKRIDARSKPALVRELLAFFAVASVAQWEALYVSMAAALRPRPVQRSDIGSISAWLRMGEREVEGQALPPFMESKFRDALIEIRGWTRREPVTCLPALRHHLHDAGIAFAVVPQLPRPRVSGMARWLRQRPMIQLSLPGNDRERFWSTFFHEVAHVVLHASDKAVVFLDAVGMEAAGSQWEDEASDWARSFLGDHGHCLHRPRITSETPSRRVRSVC
jgi:HTH-type transcriptional regulator/antitoxin HigA